MQELSKELYQKIKDTYESEIKNSSKIKTLLNKMNRENANYQDAMDFSIEIGKCLEKSFSKNISASILPDERMQYKLAKEIIEPILKENYSNIAKQCMNVQAALNKAANIGLKAIKPGYKKDKTEGIINYVSSNKYDKIEKSFIDSLSTNSKSIVDDSVRENADFHYKSGLSPKIVRRSNGKCCKWCQEQVGVYDYKEVKNKGNDVFRRHANCNCIVTYDPGDGSKAQNVWNKKIEYKPNQEEIEKRIEKSTKDEKMSQARQDLLKLNVKHNPVIDYRIQPTEEKIIKDLSGGDLTKGSCSSLAFAYIGNKSGYQVLDFRGGESCNYFSTIGIREIAKLDGVTSFIERDYSDFKAINRLLEHVEEDREYYLAVGNHAAIIKKTSEGYKYLELQSGNPKQNGFHDLTNKELRYRFNCKNSHRLFGRKIEPQNFLIDTESLYNNDEFKKIMGFINTAFESQQKGDNGHVK